MFRLDLWRRLFHHSALGLASACLLYAEAFFLPVPLLIGLYLLAGIQVLAFAAEGRRWVLPGWAANLLAGAVAGGGVSWIASELNQPDSVLAGLPLPAGLLPYIGPMLIGLLVIKMFRPTTSRDFWLLQGVGALQVALACVLATNPDSGLLFGVLLAAYLAFALGRLALHYFEEEQRIGSSPLTNGSARPETERIPFAYLMSPFCLRWSAAVVALAIPFFLLTPRIQGPVWDSSQMAAAGRHGAIQGNRVGFSPQIDLNRDGPVRLTDEEVFRVKVKAGPDQPLPVLPADQYWRGSVLDTYSRGRWSNQEIKRAFLSSVNRSPSPSLGPGEYSIEFNVGPSAGGFFLAEPVLTDVLPEESTTVDLLGGGGATSVRQFVSTRGPVLPRLYIGVKDYSYRQIIRKADGVKVIPIKDAVVYAATLRNQDVPNLSEWTSDLLKRLDADPNYHLPISLEASSLPANDEQVGRALTAYLAHSGVYGYTLDLRRQDASIDPVMDFLVNTKQGHCERFASALALMLRSQGIPSRIVVGFRGADPADNAYVIRQRQAHAWVEMLTSGQKWVALDPTPSAETTAPPPPYSWWEWWQDSQRNGKELWGGLVVNYTADAQADLWTRLRSPLAIIGVLAVVGLCLSVLAAAGAFTSVYLRRHRPRQRSAPSSAPTATGYNRLLALLARYANLQPRIGQTPREFVREGRRFLLTVPSAQAFADLPDEIVDRFYCVRFGAHTLTNDEQIRITARLNQLTAALKQSDTASSSVAISGGRQIASAS